MAKGGPEVGTMSTRVWRSWVGSTVVVCVWVLVMTLVTGVGTADASALVAERVVRETLTGLAMRRRGAERP